MCVRGRVEVCFILAVLLLAGPYLYYDLRLGIKLVSPETLRTIWSVSVILSAIFLFLTGGFSSNLPGTVLCLILAPLTVVVAILFSTWQIVFPIPEVKIKKEIGANVI